MRWRISLFGSVQALLMLTLLVVVKNVDGAAAIASIIAITAASIAASLWAMNSVEALIRRRDDDWEYSLEAIQDAHDKEIEGLQKQLAEV